MIMHNSTNDQLSLFGSVRLTSVDKSGHLTLEGIRDSLVRQEDSIIFNLIERAQYKMNSAAYDPNKISVPGFNGSLLEYMLRETETLHGKVSFPVHYLSKKIVIKER